nr:reverse transcriptase domain-containing protein [Tanacetum cinerariifolium]
MFPNILNTLIKLMLFPFSLEGAAWIWLEKEPPRSIFTWDDLVSKFINQFFPPSKTTNLQLHQLDTFYNVLNSKDQDSLNSTAGGNFLDKMPRECLAIFESKSKVRYSCNKPVVAKVSMNSSTSDISPDVTELKDMVKALLLDKKSQNQAPATVKSVEESCVTCGGAHSYRNCPATDGNVYRDNIQEFISQAFAVNYNQGNTSYRAPMMSNQIRPHSFPPVVENELEATKDTMHPANNESTEDVQPLIVQSESPILISKPINSPIIEPVNSPVSTPRPNQRPLIPYPSRLQDQKLHDKANDQREKFFQIFKDLNFNISFADALILMPKSFLKTGRALIDVFESELTLRVSKEAITFNLDQTSRYSDNYNDMTAKRTDVIDMACEEYSQEVFGFSDMIASGNPTPYYDPIVFTTSPTLTPFENSNFLLEEVDAFLALEDDLTLPEVDQSYLDSEGDILLLQDFLNDDPSLPPPNQGNYLLEVRKEVKINEAKSDKSSIDEPPKVELKDIPPHLESTFMEGNDKLPVIIAKDLSIEEKTALITVLKSHKRAIAWKLFDIKGIDPEFCTHKILIEEDFESAVQHQKRVNLKIHDVIEQDVLKVLDAGLIYPISDSPWVSPVHCIPKKGGYTVVENEDNELILTRLVMGWRVCIDYRKLNEATRKDNFPLPFMDQILERLAENQHYCFLDDFSRGYSPRHKFSKEGIEVDKAKVDVITKLPHPTTVKGIQSFLARHLCCRFKKPSSDAQQRQLCSMVARIIRYARSRPNGKIIVESIENGPYVRGMIATPGEPDLPGPVPESFHEQTDKELTKTDIKRMDAVTPPNLYIAAEYNLGVLLHNTGSRVVVNDFKRNVY